MKSISVQYQELKEGRMTQHQFLRNARMLFPNHVTQHNSFEDSVKILKNRGLLNEGDAVKGTPDKAPSYDYPTQPAKYKKVVQEPEVDEQDGIYPATTVTDIPKEEVSKPIKSKNRPDGLEPAKDKDKKNEMKKVRIVKESKKSLTELTSVSDKEIQSAEFNSLKNIQKDYLSNHPLSIQPTSFSGDKGSPLKLTDLRWYNNKDNTFGFTMTFDRPGNRDEYIDVTFYKDKQNNPVKNIRLTDKIQDSWKEYKDDIVGYLNKAMRSAQVDGKYVDNVIVALSRMTPEKIGYNQSFTESNIKELGPAAQQMAGNPEEEKASRITIIRKKRDNDEDAEIEAMIAKAEEEEAGKYTKFDDFEGGISESDKEDIAKKAIKKLSKEELDALWKAWEKRGEKAFAGILPVGSEIDRKREKLREVIKSLVNEALNEYEKGDENDNPPSIRGIINILVNDMIDNIESNDLDLEFSSKDVEDLLNNFQDTIGHRYRDEQYENIIDGAIDILKKKGYNIK